MMISFCEKYKDYAPFFVRVGIGVVFVLFAFQKLYTPDQTIGEIRGLFEGSEGMSKLVDNLVHPINFYMGLFEMIVGVGLIIGFYTRHLAALASALLALFFASFLVKYGVQNDPGLYRDIGMLGGSLSLLLSGPGPLSLDNRKRKAEVPQG